MFDRTDDTSFSSYNHTLFLILRDKVVKRTSTPIKKDKGTPSSENKIYTFIIV